MSEAIESPPSETPSPSRAKAVGGILVFGMLLSRVLGLVRESVLVSQFGIGLQSDAFKIAAQIPDTIFMLVAGGGLSSAFLPVFSDLYHKGKEKEAWRVFSIVVTLCFLAAPVLVGIAWAFTPEIVEFFRSKKPVSIVPSAVAMSRIMLPAQLAFLSGSVIIATLYARQKFWVPALAPNIYNAGIILGGVLLPFTLHMGIESLAWGALVGAYVGNLLLPAVASARTGGHFRPAISFQEPGVRKFFTLLLPIILGFSLPSMVNLVTQKAAGYYGKQDGVNTVLYLANYLMQAPLGIFGQSLALAAFPILAQHVALDRMDLYREQMARSMRSVTYLGVMSGSLMFVLSPLIVHVLYGWGAGATDARGLEQTSDCLRIYCVAIFAWCLQPVLMRGFFSLQKTKLPIVIGTAMTGLFIVLCAVVIGLGLDFYMLAWATNIAAIALVIVLYFALERTVGKIENNGLISILVRSSVAGLLAIIPLELLIRFLPPAHGKLMQASQLLVLGVLGLGVFFAVSRALKISEADYLDRVFAKVGGLAKRFRR